MAVGYGAWSVFIAPHPVSAQSATVVDGVQCSAMEALTFHIHAHLDLYQNGLPVPLPSSIGIVGGEDAPHCFYWLHVHAATPNIIHIEGPVKRTFTLGQFLDIWRATRMYADPEGDRFVTELRRAPARGVAIYVNGRRWVRDYRLVPITAHASIIVEIGKPLVRPSLFQNWGAL